MNEQETTKVIFRVWLNEPQKGEVIALFPEVPATVTAPYCDSYMHIGQHSAADCRGVIEQTRPATEDEYAALKNELERVYGYRLDVRQRRSSQMVDTLYENWIRSIKRYQ